MTILKKYFFDRDACLVAQQLLGKIIRRKYQGHWLAARIIETEAYYMEDKGSHASLGYTEKRKALFMPAGTIYMYYARGKDSLNVSCKGKGNAVLIKSAYP
ncbi:MAG: DNA-3-methyladenine glycosylase, partial [Gammaproteobacteria bacterium]|nr:DNA-3-methyladenine glycosylase [Gammaproteobacteria bacterium]